MTREELPCLIGWASKEGWNPGLADAGVAWDFDPQGFIALRHGGELVGGGSILCYEGRFGFMGLFIVRADHRSQGLGRELWRYRRDRLRERLLPGASIGMDGVIAMVPFYERGGFVFSSMDLRFEGTAAGVASPEVRPLTDFTFAEVDLFDRQHVPAPRTEFLRRWLAQPGGFSVGLGRPGALSGYGMIRPCECGYKVGPLFASDAVGAERLIRALMAFIPGSQIQLDVPEANSSAVALAQQLGFRETFRCARLYLGGIPKLPLERIYGVTSFEFG